MKSKTSCWKKNKVTEKINVNESILKQLAIKGFPSSFYKTYIFHIATAQATVSLRFDFLHHQQPSILWHMHPDGTLLRFVHNLLGNHSNESVNRSIVQRFALVAEFVVVVSVENNKPAAFVQCVRKDFALKNFDQLSLNVFYLPICSNLGNVSMANKYPLDCLA